MKYLTSKETAENWGISERSVRNYCSAGRIAGAILIGKIWKIPASSLKPIRQIRHTNKMNSLLEVLKREKDNKLPGGIYHKLQIIMTYNSNHIEGSTLTSDETRMIFDTRTIVPSINSKTFNVDDIIETLNHFKCIDLAIDSAKAKLSESLIKQFHSILKNNTSDSTKPWFVTGNYKHLQNEINGQETTQPENVKDEMKRLINYYNNLTDVTITDIIEFHQKFETIHPFQDGNGRVGRLIMFKECLKHNIVPILITDDNKYYYYRGLKMWPSERGYLIDTCLDGQDDMKKYLDCFHIQHH